MTLDSVLIMKKHLVFRWLLLCLSMGVLFSGCVKDHNCPETNRFGNKPITLSSNILSSPLRVIGNEWESKDKIGLFMLHHGAILEAAAASNIIYKDVTYVATAAGKKVQFEAVDEANKMTFPQDGSKIDLIAYYPKGLAISEAFTVDLDLATNNVDLLYSNNITAKDKATERGSLLLNFHHILSAIKITLLNENQQRIEAASVKINQLQTIAKMALKDGSITKEEKTASYNIPAVGDGYQAAMLPQQWKNNSINLAITYNGKNYIWFLPSNQIQAGERIIYELTLKKDGSVSVNINGQIEDWNDVNGGVYELDPEGNDSAGDITLTVKGELAPLEPSAHNGEILLESNADALAASLASGDDWLEIALDNTNKRISYKAKENKTDSERKAKIIVTATKSNAQGSTQREEKQKTLEIILIQKAGKTVPSLFDGGISAIKQLPVDQVISGQQKIRGVVISGNRNFSGNKNMVICDDKAGIFIRINGGTTDAFPEGTEVEVDPNGFTLTRHNNGSLQISEVTADKIVALETTHTIAPIEVSFTDLMTQRIEEELDCRLVKVDGVQTKYTTFKDNRTPYIFFDSTSKYSTTKHAITDTYTTTAPDGYYFPDLLASKYSPWKEKEMPTGNGYIIGVILREWNKKFNNFSAQLWIRNWDTDLKLDGPRK